MLIPRTAGDREYQYAKAVPLIRYGEGVGTYQRRVAVALAVVADEEIQREREDMARALRFESAKVGEQMIELAHLRAELEENTGVIQALRRQRDKAEATIERVRAVLDRWQETNVRHGRFYQQIRVALKGDNA